MDRHHVLDALYNHIWDKSKVLAGKRVGEIEHTPKGVTVHCKDGSTFDGDVVAGADGVHSLVRREMWRYSDSMEPGKVSEEEKNSKEEQFLD